MAGGGTNHRTPIAIDISGDLTHSPTFRKDNLRIDDDQTGPRSQQLVNG
jgi:hypothetical protein